MHDESDDEACLNLLTRDEPAETNVVSVAIESTADDRLAMWQREFGDELPKRATVVDAGGGATKRSQASAFNEVPTVDIELLPVDGDLLDISLAIGSTLGEWQSTDERTVLCLHSMSALLGSYDRDDVIALVNALNDRCERFDVLAHHHFDPDRHDEETLAMVRTLYDAVVEHVPDGGWIVTTDETSTVDPSFRTTTTPPGGTAKSDPDDPETIPIPYSFETALDLISKPRRRTLLYYFRASPDDVFDLDQIVDEVHEREQAIPIREPAESRQALKASLVHIDLPKLESIGVIRFDETDGVVRYHSNPALESAIRYVEALELG